MLHRAWECPRRDLLFYTRHVEQGVTLMKVHDFAYQVAARTIELLENTQHYKIPEELRKDILGKIHDEVNSLLKKAS